jgi:hypothetical protein
MSNRGLVDDRTSIAPSTRAETECPGLNEYNHLLVRCRPGIGLRPPDWRWVRARLLGEEGLRLRRFDDEWTRRARSFQREMNRRGGDPEHPGLAKLDPAVFGALRLSRGDERRRWEIEARLLAAQDSSGIAARTVVEAEIVTAFEALSYDVRDRLHASDWILAECLGLRAVTGTPRVMST